ncbi:uncharacterized protein E0L32_000108 [Thyridium curvatum]|uniref:Uncharacterized protein n=1 Tax=Thyridium curvatum TaxID=1093900 RepID=A0A507BAY5_9PEZI|nr:uncharacterized protein E0L32_000108 [Thyridium curvatum]TPX15774.1 hypothetical protein E0L32_000108 [Thyridium curvatum]
MDAPISSPRTHQTSAATTSARTSPANKMAPPPPAAMSSPSTDAFLKDFTLVAEAAKRAQMAVMMRDFESVGLS